MIAPAGASAFSLPLSLPFPFARRRLQLGARLDTQLATQLAFPPLELLLGVSRTLGNGGRLPRVEEDGPSKERGRMAVEEREVHRAGFNVDRMLDGDGERRDREWRQARMEEIIRKAGDKDNKWNEEKQTTMAERKKVVIKMCDLYRECSIPTV
ncbi:hypothetical protein BDN72DRAFT_858080 [Pluteus cervinus]|uniref:Uncharacterized protein n=1 Tax=Pluteus cervinus TaxID=181527 RepID=A0ACD3AUB6_9AGAR|nr:hypothetical protein BDN72DRAFT_858080 [Pluteus cervinus]